VPRFADPVEIRLGQRQLREFGVDRRAVAEAIRREHALPAQIAHVLAQLEAPVRPTVAELEVRRHLQRRLDELQRVRVQLVRQHGGVDPRERGVAARIGGVQSAHGREPPVAVEHHPVALNEQRLGLLAVDRQFVVDGATGIARLGE
jgi:hypothetical protein